MGVRRLDLAQVAEILRQEGWDVVVEDDVIARRDGPEVWHLFADRGGRIRLEVTREVDMPRGQRLRLDGREYRVLREMHEVIHVLTSISREDELVPVLHTLEDILYRRLWEKPTV